MCVQLLFWSLSLANEFIGLDAVVLAAIWRMLEQMQDRLQAQEASNEEAFGKINQTLGECQRAVSVELHACVPCE